MQRPVELPTGPLIGYLHLCQKIAKAIYPINAHPEGIDCVWAKSCPPDVPRALSEADRKQLLEVLPKLPPLKYPMSEEDVTAFMEAYSKLEEPPSWTPCLVTKGTLAERLQEHKRNVDHHVQALRAEHRAGRLFPVSRSHIPLDGVEMGAQLTRDDAKAYLTRIGLPYEEGDPNEGMQREAAPAPAVAGKEPKLKPGAHEEIARRHEELKRNGVRNATMRLASEYGVSDRMIRTVVKAAKDRHWASPLTAPPRR